MQDERGTVVGQPRNVWLLPDHIAYRCQARPAPSSTAEQQQVLSDEARKKFEAVTCHGVYYMGWRIMRYRCCGCHAVMNNVRDACSPPYDYRDTGEGKNGEIGDQLEGYTRPLSSARAAGPLHAPRTRQRASMEPKACSGRPTGRPIASTGILWPYWAAIDHVQDADGNSIGLETHAWLHPDHPAYGCRPKEPPSAEIPHGIYSRRNEGVLRHHCGGCHATFSNVPQVRLLAPRRADRLQAQRDAQSNEWRHRTCVVAPVPSSVNAADQRDSPSRMSPEVQPANQRASLSPMIPAIHHVSFEAQRDGIADV